MLSATVDVGFLFGFSVGSRHSSVVNISHPLFADDTLVCCGSKLDHLRYLRASLLCFNVVSSLKINLAKSELVLVGIVDNVEGLAGILGYGVSSLPLEYLDLPMEASYKAKAI
jgi:hypothetical protein